ncbi:hypothetical protein V495_00019 [Pseudogymnoascus sp. VKM F-4514 (FW-929)]|nr:hypothetical protein V495_00019 [Pseudogymnoascus sp. VKM F-4514 (FW-929)]KFY66154.1 hypothetical protein V497_01107 [Pseudogymnoascus sp. VKM F-4516 (FW-969)]
MTIGAYTGSRNVAYGLALSGRTAALNGAESTLGPTVAIVPVQVKLQHSMVVEDILKERAIALRQLQTHPALQYGITRIRTVNEAAQLASGFQTLLSIYPPLSVSSGSDDLQYEHTEEPHEPFSLCLICSIISGEIIVKAMFDPNVLCEIQLSRVLRQFEYYLQALMKAESQTKLERLLPLNPSDRSEILQWNNAVPETVERCLHELFSAQAQRQPAAMAVDASDGSATYAELDKMSSRLAHELRRRGVSTERPIAFIFEKSIWTIVAVLAIMKAGGVCVPINRSDPHARKAALISGANIKTILVSSKELENSIELAPDVLVVAAASISELPDINASPHDNGTGSPGDLAYIIFTSGSTGDPKGVMLEHRCLASTLSAIARRHGWREPGCRILQFAAHVWDVSMGDIFGALLFGGCLCIPSEEVRATSLIEFIQSNKVNWACLTPTVRRTISPEDVPGLQYLLCGGEPIGSEASKTWGRALCLTNAWGTCEVSILATAVELTPDSRYPESIGMPLNCAIWIINPENSNELTPIGAVGELVVEGPGVARGYLNDTVKTKATFIPQPPWAPRREKKVTRFYRTGDLARYNADGSICFIGRRDNQVKLRGQRFELGELENVLGGCGEVRDVFTTTLICEGRTELVSVICLTDPQLQGQRVLQDVSPELTVEVLCAVRDHVRSRLPSYMVPTIWLAVEQMPRTASTKLDRAAISEWLKKKNLSSPRAALGKRMTVALATPATAEEILLQSVWSSVLVIPREGIGRESSFVQLGGDSILAMQAASRCHKLGLRIAATALLGSEPLATIAESALPIESAADVPVPLRASSLDDIPDSLNTRLSQLSLSNAHFCKENLESIATATDVQAVMFAVGQSGVKGYKAFIGNFRLEFTPTFNTARLRMACEQVVQHHPILRTVFLQHGSVLYQVVLKVPPTETVVERDQSTQANMFCNGTSLARFHLFSDGQLCHHLHLEIHHALYDAVSLGLVFRDLDAAYMGKPLSDGPHFHSWLWNVEALDGVAPRKFWTEALTGSSMTHIASPPVGPTRGCIADAEIRMRVPLQNIKSPLGRPSSVMKAAWALVLSHALGMNDVVFGEVSANRYLTTQGIDQVRGPCINFLPVRVRLKQAMTLASLITQIQDHAMASLPHQHIGFRSIVKDCTNWPRWTRFSTTLVYQSHGFIGDSLKIGGSDGTLVSDGQAGDSTDLMIIATPGSEYLEIKFIFSPETLSSEQIRWISQSLATILHAIPFILEQSLAQIGNSLRSSLGSYVVPLTPSSELPNGHLETPSENARKTVLQAWKEVELLQADQSEDRSMFCYGADVVTALLLSEYYRSCGYDIITEDIVQRPSRLNQALLVDLKTKSLQTQLNSNEI